MMPSLSVFRQATAEADVRSEMSNVGLALLVLASSDRRPGAAGGAALVRTPSRAAGVYFAYARRSPAHGRRPRCCASGATAGSATRACSRSFPSSTGEPVCRPALCA